MGVRLVVCAPSRAAAMHASMTFRGLLRRAEHAREDLHRALDLFGHDVARPEAQQPLTLGEVARAHEHGHLGGHAPRGVEHALRRLRVVHQQHQQPRVAQVRVPQGLFAGGVAVEHRVPQRAAAAHVLGV